MKPLSILFLFLAGCVAPTSEPTRAAPDEPIAHGNVVMHSTASKRVDAPADGTNLLALIEAAGGLKNCDDCFQEGGAAYLLERAGKALVRRNDKTIEVPKADFASFLILPGDEVFVSHKF